MFSSLNGKQGIDKQRQHIGFGQRRKFIYLIIDAGSTYFFFFSGGGGVGIAHANLQISSPDTAVSAHCVNNMYSPCIIQGADDKLGQFLDEGI